jgi:Na+-translocating ferredoxin:NAD+ oxidoreductase RnfA subunit
MTVNLYPLLALAVFSGLSVNLILQCGLCLKDTAIAEEFGIKRLFFGLGIIFVSIVLLWLFFSFIRAVLPLGLFEYMLLFPASSLLFFCFDTFLNRYVVRNTANKKEQVLSIGALTSAALFITLNVAGNLIEAAVTALGFTLGVAVVFIITGEIRRRSEMEAVPPLFKNGPLALIAMGLLSLIFSSAAIMLYKVLEG